MTSLSTDRNNIAAAILAGGQATRYCGVAKGLLELAPGHTIIERLLAEITACGINEIAILANDPSPYTGFSRRIIPDLRPGIGPLGGIEAAMTTYCDRYSAILFLPCDLPGITSQEISRLLKTFNEGQAPIVYAETESSRAQPLCAVVHCRLAGAISAAIDDGVRQVLALWRTLGGEPVSFPVSTPFYNVNSPADLADWLASDANR
ncbi:MAG: molybdenum cofactor guanylyltransferase [Armatimonadota bacterium]